MRTDNNNNPTAFTTQLAQEAGLISGMDYEIGDTFTSDGMVYYTAKIIGNPIAVTIRLIDKLGFRTKSGHQRWVYIMIPFFIWNLLSFDERRDVIGFMYQQEGGFAMRSMFPNYGKV